MADFEEVVNTRRSIREYDSKEVEDEKIEKILKAAMQAPGSRLKAEPWEFIVVKNRKTLKEIGEIKPRVSDAPVAIVLVANIERAFYKDGNPILADPKNPPKDNPYAEMIKSFGLKPIYPSKAGEAPKPDVDTLAKKMNI